MIQIVNMGPHNDPDLMGERHYELRINRDVIACFRHRRGDGLEVCLRKAADAVKATDNERIRCLLELAKTRS
jgi:hypothetical protein